MKKIILSLTIAISLFSCSKEKEIIKEEPPLVDLRKLTDEAEYHWSKRFDSLNKIKKLEIFDTSSIKLNSVKYLIDDLKLSVEFTTSDIKVTYFKILVSEDNQNWHYIQKQFIYPNESRKYNSNIFIVDSGLLPEVFSFNPKFVKIIGININNGNILESITKAL